MPTHFQLWAIQGGAKCINITTLKNMSNPITRADARRIFAIMQSIIIFHVATDRWPRASDLPSILEKIWPESGSWSTTKVHRALMDALDAGAVQRITVTPTLFEWSARPHDIDTIRLTNHLAERLE